MSEDTGGTNVRTSRMWILIVAGGLILLFGVVSPYVSAQATQDHETTEGSVLSSEMTTKQVLEDGESVYKSYPVVRYEYEVDGERYENDRIYFDRGTCVPGEDVCGTREYDRSPMTSTEVDDYPEGETVTVHYDPGDPSSSYLVPVSGFPTLGAVLWGAIGSLVFVLGVAGLKGFHVERLFGPLWTRE